MHNHWSSELPTVYKILLNSPDSIVDDTAIERLISWLEETLKDEAGRGKLLDRKAGTLEFLQSHNVFTDPLTIAFALR